MNQIKSLQTIRIARRQRSHQAKVEFGNGAIAPKVAIQRRKDQARVKVEFGNGAIAPKVAIQRRKPA